MGWPALCVRARMKGENEFEAFHVLAGISSAPLGWYEEPREAAACTYFPGSLCQDPCTGGTSSSHGANMWQQLQCALVMLSASSPPPMLP